MTIPWHDDTAARIMALGDEFFRLHPEVVTAAFGYAERQRTPMQGVSRGHGSYTEEEWEK